MKTADEFFFGEISTFLHGKPLLCIVRPEPQNSGWQRTSPATADG
jgi:hypothetical protein